MRLSFGQELRQVQKQILAPRMLQSMEILKLPIMKLQERIENVGDDADLQEVYDTERHLLYVACTRARDGLWVSGVEPASEFLGDLAG